MFLIKPAFDFPRTLFVRPVQSVFSWEKRKARDVIAINLKVLTEIRKRFESYIGQGFVNTVANFQLKVVIGFFYNK